MEKRRENTVAPVPTPAATAALANLYICDEGFRAEFDKDPKAALAMLGGKPLPPGLEVVVHRNDGNRWHLTLPSEEIVEALSRAMGDKDLDNISGGTSREERLQRYQQFLAQHGASAAGNLPPRPASRPEALLDIVRGGWGWEP
ncbi:MAG: hypothetical protein OXU34_04740 [Gammaproteobacteria bacterium]|nr:hypothetical protein [Gammaproteobacteria bacterium]